jgi:hypothetical protein
VRPPHKERRKSTALSEKGGIVQSDGSPDTFSRDAIWWIREMLRGSEGPVRCPHCGDQLELRLSNRTVATPTWLTMCRACRLAALITQVRDCREHRACIQRRGPTGGDNAGGAGP